MQITLSPQFGQPVTSITRVGDVLYMDGAGYDLSGVPENVLCTPDPRSRFSGYITRVGGIVTARVLVHPPMAEGNGTQGADGLWIVTPPDHEGDVPPLADGFTVVPEHPALTPEQALEAAKAGALSAMLARIDEFLSRFTGGVPAGEVASWTLKALEAEKVLTGGSSAMISAEAAVLGQTAEQVAADIAQRAALYGLIVAQVTGLRRLTEAGIAGADSVAGVDAVIAAALDQARGMAQAYGLDFP